MSIFGQHQRTFFLIGVGLLTCLAGYIFYTFSPYDSGLFPKCPVLVSTGYQCTGCGSQRAFHDLMHLRIGSAFSSNPLAVVALPYLFLGYIAEWKAISSSWWSRLRKTLFGVTAIWVILGGIVIFTVGRNLI